MDQESEVEDVGTIILFLSSEDKDAQFQGLVWLMDLCDSAYGSNGAVIGEALRKDGAAGLRTVSSMLDDPEVDIKQNALCLVGNLCSDAFDSASILTKHQLLDFGVQQQLFACLTGDQDEATLMMACGVLQNLTSDKKWSAAIIQANVSTRLDELVMHENAMIVRYAAGALKNLSAAVPTKLSEQAQAAVDIRARNCAVELFRYQRACRLLTKWVQRLSPEVRLKRLLAARGIALPAERPDHTPRGTIEEAVEVVHVDHVQDRSTRYAYLNHYATTFHVELMFCIETHTGWPHSSSR